MVLWWFSELCVGHWWHIAPSFAEGQRRSKISSSLLGELTIYFWSRLMTVGWRQSSLALIPRGKLPKKILVPKTLDVSTRVPSLLGCQRSEGLMCKGHSHKYIIGVHQGSRIFAKHVKEAHIPKTSRPKQSYVFISILLGLWMRSRRDIAAVLASLYLLRHKRRRSIANTCPCP